MNGYQPSKENPPASAPGYPPMYETAMPGTVPAPDYSGPANTMYYPPTGPQYAGNYPPYNAGYPQGHNVVVTSQPMVIMPPVRAHEKDYLGYSIFTMLCCCLPIGIAALVYSINTRDANNRGDADGAHRKSRTALTLNNVALGLGLAITIAWIAYVIYINVAIRQYINSNSNYNYQG